MSIVVDKVLCFDTNILIKYLPTDERDEAAIKLVVSGFSDEVKIVAPTWAWAEVGSVLRKKVRADLLTADEADPIWQRFGDLPIEYVDSEELRSRTWEIAKMFQTPTLYDAAFLACTEVAFGAEVATREFWTADRVLLRSLGNARPSYIRELGT